MSDTDFTNATSRRIAFSWGKVVAGHQIGRYGIIEYLERNMNSRELSGRTLFHVYVDGRDQSVSCSSLDAALLAAVSLAHRCSHAGEYMARMIGIEP